MDPSAFKHLITNWREASKNSTDLATQATFNKCCNELDDLLQVMVAFEPVDTRLNGLTAPTHKCKVCGALWILWATHWNLASRECGKCCDNMPMRDQIVELAISDIYSRREI